MLDQKRRRLQGEQAFPKATHEKTRTWCEKAFMSTAKPPDCQVMEDHFGVQFAAFFHKFRLQISLRERVEPQVEVRSFFDLQVVTLKSSAGRCAREA